MITWFEGFETAPEKTPFYRSDFNTYKNTKAYNQSNYFINGNNGWKTNVTQYLGLKELYEPNTTPDSNYFSYANCEYGTVFAQLDFRANLAKDLPEIVGDIFTIGLMVCSGGANGEYIMISSGERSQSIVTIRLNSDKTALILSGLAYNTEKVIHTFENPLNDWSWINLEVQVNRSVNGWVKVRVGNTMVYEENRDFSVFEFKTMHMDVTPPNLYKCIDNIYFATGDDVFHGQIIVRNATGVVSKNQNYSSKTNDFETDLTDIVTNHGVVSTSENSVESVSLGAKYLKKYDKSTSPEFSGYVVASRFRDPMINNAQGMNIYSGSTAENSAIHKSVIGTDSFNTNYTLITQADMDATSNEIHIGFGTKE